MKHAPPLTAAAVAPPCARALAREERDRRPDVLRTDQRAGGWYQLLRYTCKPGLPSLAARLRHVSQPVQKPKSAQLAALSVVCNIPTKTHGNLHHTPQSTGGRRAGSSPHSAQCPLDLTRPSGPAKTTRQSHWAGRRRPVWSPCLCGRIPPSTFAALRLCTPRVRQPFLGRTTSGGNSVADLMLTAPSGRSSSS